MGINAFRCRSSVSTDRTRLVFPVRPHRSPSGSRSGRAQSAGSWCDRPHGRPVTPLHRARRRPPRAGARRQRHPGPRCHGVALRPSVVAQGGAGDRHACRAGLVRRCRRGGWCWGGGPAGHGGAGRGCRCGSRPEGIADALDVVGLAAAVRSGRLPPSGDTPSRRSRSAVPSPRPRRSAPPAAGEPGPVRVVAAGRARASIYAADADEGEVAWQRSNRATARSPSSRSSVGAPAPP